MAGGRPSKFKPEFIEQAQKLCALGATDREVADFFKVTEQTINNWKVDYPRFFESLKVAKKEADERVVKSLYRRALGYSHDSVHVSNFQGAVTLTPIVEHYPPDTTAAIFWLKNRMPEDWRDVKAVEHSGEMTHKHVSELSDDALADIATGGSAGAAKATASKKGTAPVH